MECHANFLRGHALLFYAFDDWFVFNLKSKCNLHKLPWKVVFDNVLWHFREWRCNHVFNPSLNLSFNIILQCSTEWYEGNQSLGGKPVRAVVKMHWSPHTSGSCKLNIDGSFLKESFETLMVAGCLILVLLSVLEV